MVHRYNTVDTADAKEAYQKLDGFLSQEQGDRHPDNLGSGQNALP